MSKKPINLDLFSERMREISAYGMPKASLNESTSLTSTATLIESVKANDGNIYGVIKENKAFYIKVAKPTAGVLTESDFKHINGLENITDFKYSTQIVALRQLNSKVGVINESFEYISEEEEEEMAPERQEAPAPEPSPAPEGDSEPSMGDEPMPEPAPESEPEMDMGSEEEAPAPSPEPEPEMGSEEGPMEDSPIDKAKSFIGKAVHAMKNTEVTSSDAREMINQLLGSVDIRSLAPEDKEAIMNKIRHGNEMESQEQAPAPQQESMMFEEFGAEDFDDDILEALEANLYEDDDDEMEEVGGMEDEITAVEPDDALDVPAGPVDSAPMASPMDAPAPVEAPMDATIKSGRSTVTIDLSSKKIDVSLEESLVKKLAGKLNISESKLKGSEQLMGVIKEEVAKKQAELIKEEKVRKVVHNIIKEQLGLKKKSLNESTNPERVKLEKLVEQVLKKK